MKAAILSQSGMAIAEVPKPEIEPNEILVRVRAAGLNRADLLMTDGRMHGPLGGAGTIAGLEWAGEVVETGSESTGFKLGDRVIQFCDKGSSYRAAVFVATQAEGILAEAGKSDIEIRFGRKVVTRVLPAATFYPAEGYHQNYYTNNPLRYRYYRYRCGRDERLREVWGDDAPLPESG